MPAHQLRVLYERNALYTILKNYDAATLERVLPAALLLAAQRGLMTGKVETAPWVLGNEGGGADVALAYNRTRAEADETAAEVRAPGRRAVTIQADVTAPAACAALVAQTVKDLGRLDVLINMASVYRARPLAELTAAHWDAQLDVDLRAAFLCAHAAAPHMRKHGGGRIINFSDWVAASGRPRYLGYVPYFVAKRGGRPDLGLEHLESHYENIQKVNDGMLERIQDVVENDADVNALIILQGFADLLTMAISKDLSKIEPLFFRSRGE